MIEIKWAILDPRALEGKWHKDFFSKSKKGKFKIRICNDDLKQVNWGIPRILNNKINFLQIYI